MDMFIRVVRDNYANFKGRARRKEYWMFYLISLLIGLGLMQLDRILFSNKDTISNLFSVAIFIPTIAVLIRRLHDTNRSGLWALLLVAPIIGFLPLIPMYFDKVNPILSGGQFLFLGYVVLFITWGPMLYFLIQDSDIGDNDYGPSEKYPEEDDSDDDFFFDQDDADPGEESKAPGDDADAEKLSTG